MQHFSYDLLILSHDLFGVGYSSSNSYKVLHEWLDVLVNVGQQNTQQKECS